MPCKKCGQPLDPDNETEQITQTCILCHQTVNGATDEDLGLE